MDDELEIIYQKVASQDRYVLRVVLMPNCQRTFSSSTNRDWKRLSQLDGNPPLHVICMDEVDDNNPFCIISSDEDDEEGKESADSECSSRR